MLIHSFQLDADYSVCSLPLICPRKQAMFHPPSSLSDHLSHFLSIEEVTRVLTNLNGILKTTAFNGRASNPLFWIAMLLMGLIIMGGTVGRFDFDFDFHSNSSENSKVQDYSMDSYITSTESGSESVEFSMFSTLLPVFLGFIPFTLFFVCFCCCKCSREHSLKNHLRKWNRSV